MSRVNRHAERSARTRGALLDAATDLFGERGYAAVPVEELVRRAGVTRGALYHQFPDGKPQLFLAVVERTEEALMARIGERVLGSNAPADPLAALRQGVAAALDASQDPVIARITLLDAPAVLGWEAWRELGARYALGTVRAALTAAAEAGAIAPGPVDPLAQLLLAAVEEAALVVSRAEDPDGARAAAQAALDRVIDGLRA